MRKTGPVRAFLALGSNMGDKIANLDAALGAIAELADTRIVRASRIYRTPPWGKTDQDWFANAVIEIETRLSPDVLLDAALAIEVRLGRVRRERWGPRVIDIDILSHGDSRSATERLKLPHPAMGERAFVLLPLREIAPDYRIDGTEIAGRLAGLDTRGIEPMGDFAPRP
ncbi:MAG TPA: 2-amino-4-hydroxy-6-hydroxymethyldihydropteridine diphosphokinase [Rhabdaerophilum sp.]|nr:2-amino-4-hydroxy-6-hydroxymethyldihydropteridine diphosphokinase [Rhabdaerophilum sp.]